MKTNLIIPAVFVIGLAFAPVAMSNTNDPGTTEISFIQDSEKTKIDKENLPEAVKETLKNDETTRDAEVKEAWQVRGDDGKMFYAIKFDHNGTEISKKYDTTGKEVKEKKD
jgi:hypothetical protein